MTTLDAVDRALIHALHIDGRAPFTKIGDVLGVSTQTVARRYRRLRAEAALRVVGLPDPQRAGQAEWMVRLTATPHTAQDLAQALARRADTAWIKLMSGGTEICVNVHTPAASDHALLLRDIPRTASITAVSAHQLLHRYFGGPTAWLGRANALDAAQIAALTPVHAGPGKPLTADDDALMAALQRDGRAGLAELATATGWSAATVARRLADLQAGGTVFFDLEIAPEPLGVTTQALLWMAVAPAQLDRVARKLATHPELALVAATTGPANLVAQALCPDAAALHHYLTHRLGALDAIRTLETAPVLRTVKAAASR
ncbi:Lrp/AsnC family transcriptional regulator [Amycolatopsis mediterranei S699]|uniref:Lrp/AsnC family transcriptional regulator n=2 Tax=Amycolatopsis mediterranei TaxID=33910 RepID=A0A0H3DI12_AMYMU|nr:AsnC family transcriptional regulator [Amycolatopsis mediterranei]ADJ49832.1 Lrp/AsnC family transcriptional regulator [Amycolatopsis mediterranei U32]AEK46820.1 Lrp/AsnC family transcriptional regulator [Amycolatopsis mediterranei S699]AFO81540.1 Lrp/AsnC family transcriptional regulator [Amycolatopsis mediterranei S699]AGT88669.1 Lrp/AsnC family transcriptional regulator [Amycolatopsis mediterranei RB]KDO07918.1 AsnC family transcriptional regulator [Amycolatopsis mediterranei]